MACGLWFVDYGLRFMVYGLWFAVYGLWFAVCGLWFMVYGLRFVASPAVHPLPAVDDASLFGVEGLGFRV